MLLQVLHCNPMVLQKLENAKNGLWKAEYSLRESVSAQGREGRGFDSDPGRNLKKKKKKKAIFYLVIRKSR
jgi:hypothetical protein